MTLIDVGKCSPKEKSPSFWHKVECEGDTDEKTHGSENSLSELMVV